MDNNKKDKTIIAPEQLTAKRRGAETASKVIFNVILIIFAIVATIALWGFSGIYLYEHLFSPDYLQKTAEMLLFLSIFALCVFIVMLLWQQYNYRVFGKRKRRAFPEAIADEQLAGMHNTAVESVQVLKNAKIVWLKREGEEGSPEEVKICKTDTGEIVELGRFNPTFRLGSDNNQKQTAFIPKTQKI